MRRRCALVAALVATLLVTGCFITDTEPRESSAISPQTSLPADEVSILPVEDAGALAIDLSRALYDHAPVVTLAGADDADGQRRAATTAAELGVPLLLTPGADGEAVGELRDELTRLAAATVLTVGDGATAWAGSAELALDVVPTETSARVAEAPPAAMAGAHAALTTGDTPPASSDTVPASSDTPTPPSVRPAPPLTGLTVLTRDTPETVAAAATARAAGAHVLVTEATDPRAEPALIDALAARPASHVLALGDAFGPVETLRDRLAVAATGVHLPGGGQTVFPGRVMVALYGHPGSDVLGALGEQSMDETIERARTVAAEYEPLVDVPVVPTLEIITTVASAGAGPAGDYSRRTPVETLEPWIEAAGEAGVYVVLDLQPGHTDFLTQAKEYRELLVHPHVGLALDPEWRLAPDEQHMVNIGSVDAAEVNQVIEWLADLTAEHTLPQKLLIVHQFMLRMITNRDALETGHDEVAVLLHADGFGTPELKHATWDALHLNPPEDAWWGWKNFYDEDRPTMSPAETLEVEPMPRFISYQ